MSPARTCAPSATGRVGVGACSPRRCPNDDLSTRVARLHEPVRFDDLIETENVGGCGPVGSAFGTRDEIAERELGERKIGAAKDECAGEEAEVHAARQLQRSLSAVRGPCGPGVSCGRTTPRAVSAPPR